MNTLGKLHTMNISQIGNPGMSNSLFDWNQNSNEMKDCCYCLVAK